MFSPEVRQQLKFYVYRLIDPRNGETFYVGKGKGNRVFQHAAGELPADSDADSAKLARIRQIKLSNFEVQHVIHRHGMESATAMEVEAALIDAYPGLTNAVAGQGSDAYGVMHAEEIVRRYEAKDAEFEHRVILISVYRTAAETSLYDATRYAWRIDPRRAANAQYALPLIQGLIVGAFEPAQWLEATTDNFPVRESMPGRWGFTGNEAPEHVRKLYVGRRVPAQYRRRGAANPIKYVGV